MFDFSTDPTQVYTFWAGLLGGIALTLATHGTDQFLVQRLLSARSAKEASTGLVLSGFIVFAQFVLFLVIGAMLYTFYQHTPLPRPLTRTDEVLPLFVITSLPHGISGFIVAAIVAAALSPSINSLAATTVNDFYVKYIRPDADETTLMRVSRQATIFWGVAQIAVALGAQFVTRSVLDSGLAVLSLAAGPVLGAFLVGVLSRRTGPRGMLIGMLTGIAALFWIWRSGAIAWTWYAFVGAAITVGRCTGDLPRPRSHMNPFAGASFLLRSGVTAGAYPGASIEVGRRETVIWRGAFGSLTYEEHAPAVDADTIFDLASLTKVIATATLTMRAIDEGLLTLDDLVADWIADWKGADRQPVTIRDLLAHSSGLTAYLPFFRDHTGRVEFEQAIARCRSNTQPRYAIHLLRPWLHPSWIHSRGPHARAHRGALLLECSTRRPHWRRSSTGSRLSSPTSR